MERLIETLDRVTENPREEAFLELESLLRDTDGKSKEEEEEEAVAMVRRFRE